MPQKKKIEIPAFFHANEEIQTPILKEDIILNFLTLELLIGKVHKRAVISNIFLSFLTHVQSLSVQTLFLTLFSPFLAQYGKYDVHYAQG